MSKGAVRGRTLVGRTFRHRTMLDMDWVPEPGQTWGHDAPKTVCTITRVARGTVWFQTGNGGRWHTDQATLLAEYPELAGP